MTVEHIQFTVKDALAELEPAWLSALQVYVPASVATTRSILSEPLRIIAYGDNEPLSRAQLTDTSDSGDA